MNTSPLFIIDSDTDDRDLMQEAWKELGFHNQLFFFKNAEDVLHTLQTTSTVPFLIISEIILPKMSGFELKQHLMENSITNFKSIPFVFFGRHCFSVGDRAGL